MEETNIFHTPSSTYQQPVLPQGLTDFLPEDIWLDLCPIARKFLPYQLHGTFLRLQTTFELGILHRGKNLLEARPGLIPGSDQVIATHQRRRMYGLRWR